MVKRFMKSMNWLMFASGVLTVILGIALFFMPVRSLTSAAILIGLVIAVSGIAELLNALKIPRSQRSSWMLGEGIITTVIGAWMVFGNGSQVFWNILPFVFAALVMVNGVIRIQHADALRIQGSGKWKWLAILGIGETVFGFFLIFSPLLSAQIGTILMATVMVLYGASNVALALNAENVSNLLRNLVRNITRWQPGHALGE